MRTFAGSRRDKSKRGKERNGKSKDKSHKRSRKDSRRDKKQHKSVSLVTDRNLLITVSCYL